MKLKNNKGSVTLYVLIAMLFFVILLLGIYTTNLNNQKAQVEAQNSVNATYNEGDTNAIYNQVYQNQFQDPYVKQNRILYYDGLSGNTTNIWKDLSGNNHNGTINGAVWDKNGFIFDGVDDWVNCGKINDMKMITLEVTTSFNELNELKRQCIIGNWEAGGGGIYLESDNKVVVEYFIGDRYYTAISQVTIQTNKTYTFSASYDGETIKLYVDGKLEGSHAIVGTIGNPISDTVMALGTNPSGAVSAGVLLKGKIYSARIYDKALSVEEIGQNYKADANRYKSDVLTKEAYGATWARVFYHNNHNGGVIFTNEQEALSSNTEDKYSILGQLENYKMADGKFEFLLEYPGIEGYNRWKQTSNPVTTLESVTGYEPITISWTNMGWGGLAKRNGPSTFLKGTIGSSDFFYAIGAYHNWNGGIPGPDVAKGIQEVYLWVRINQ